MQSPELIPVDIFCRHHGIEISFIRSLNDFGLMQVTRIEEAEYIPVTQLREAEKLVRLHTDLEINPEGIDAIMHLLNLLKQMQAEILALNNQLSVYQLTE